MDDIKHLGSLCWASFSRIFSRLIHSVEYSEYFILFSDKDYFSVCVCFILFIYLRKNGHWGCFLPFCLLEIILL